MDKIIEKVLYCIIFAIMLIVFFNIDYNIGTRRNVQKLKETKFNSRIKQVELDRGRQYFVLNDSVKLTEYYFCATSFKNHCDCKLQIGDSVIHKKNSDTIYLYKI